MLQIAKPFLEYAIKNSPAIMTAIGATGVITTSVLSVRAYKQTVQERDMMPVDAPTKAVVKNTWRYWVIPSFMGTTSIACIVGSNVVMSKRQAFLISAYSIAAGQLLENRKKLVELVGPKKENELHKEVIHKTMGEPPTNVVVGDGEYLCYESLSGRYFKSDLQAIRKAQNDLNHELFGGVWLPLNNLYEHLGLPRIGLGDEIGWFTDNMVDLQVSSMVTEKGVPCLVIDYVTEPISGA